jgi:hypothetical protein
MPVAADTTKLSAPQLVGHLERLEQELRQAQARIREAEQRALLAEKSSRDAWAFAKSLRGTGRDLTR